MNQDLMNKIQVCRYLKISRPTLDRMIMAGKIKTQSYAGFVVIPRSEVTKWDVNEAKHNYKVRLKSTKV